MHIFENFLSETYATELPCDTKQLKQKFIFYVAKKTA